MIIIDSHSLYLTSIFRITFKFRISKSCLNPLCWFVEILHDYISKLKPFGNMKVCFIILYMLFYKPVSLFVCLFVLYKFNNTAGTKLHIIRLLYFLVFILTYFNIPLFSYKHVLWKITWKIMVLFIWRISSHYSRLFIFQHIFYMSYKMEIAL